MCCLPSAPTSPPLQPGCSAQLASQRHTACALAGGVTGQSLRLVYLLRLLRLGRVIRVLREIQPGRASGPVKVRRQAG